MPEIRADHVKQGRLKSRSEFVAVQRSGQKWVAPTVIVEIRPEGDDKKDGPARLGLTASKKTAKRAVDRNRIRRRLRAAGLAALKDLKGVDVVLVGRPATLTCGFDNLTKDINWCLKRLGVLNPPEQNT
jgi:ribonuclease P protein component